MYYPKCKPGYYAFGCCICRPNTPDCAALGFNGNFDIACSKKVIIGDPISMDCTNGQVYDAGLCYDACPADGWYGVGPVCWKAPPSGWVECGMGAAKDSSACTSAIFDQVASVGNMALSIATLGVGSAAKLVKNAAQTAKLQKQFKTLKDATKASRVLTDSIAATQGKYPPIETGKSLGDALNADPSTLTAEDIVRVSAQIAALADPSGISGVVSAYSYPKCTQVAA